MRVPGFTAHRGITGGLVITRGPDSGRARSAAAPLTTDADHSAAAMCAAGLTAEAASVAATREVDSTAAVRTVDSTAADRAVAVGSTAADLMAVDRTVAATGSFPHKEGPPSGRQHHAVGRFLLQLGPGTGAAEASSEIARTIWAGRRHGACAGVPRCSEYPPRFIRRILMIPAGCL
jgi:hypothetical protein